MQAVKKSPSEHGFGGMLAALRRAFAEFLLVPTLIITGFLFLALGSYLIDSVQVVWLRPFRDFLRSHVFANSEATSGLLEAIAAGIITLTSITISLLLVAVQQSAGSMTGQVFDQFLRRRTNQIYFGFFVGLALYSLITLATVNDPFNPVFGASIAFCGTVVALYLLLLLLYTTVHQMRSEEIIEAIHGHILAARTRQLEFIAKTRRDSAYTGAATVRVSSQHHGNVTRVDIDSIAGALRKNDGEVILLVSIGAFVAFGDQIAQVDAASIQDAEAIGMVVERAVELERERDITLDPAFGITQIETIAWTSISTSKSNPAPGLTSIQCLRDVMSRWASEDEPKASEKPAAVVYRDNVFERLLETFETLAIVASESLQHQNYIEVLRTFALMFDRIPDRYQPRAEDVVLRILAVLGEFALTHELDKSLTELERSLAGSGRRNTAAAVRNAHDAFSDSVGKLGSRSTRARH